MKERKLYILWAALYALCAGLGLVQLQGVGQILQVVAGVAFFAPAGVLVYRGIKEENKRQLRLVRRICLVSLIATVLVFCANVLAVNDSALAGRVLHVLLDLVSVPMLCIRYWALSLFLWACLLMTTFLKLPKKD